MEKLCNIIKSLKNENPEDILNALKFLGTPFAVLKSESYSNIRKMKNDFLQYDASGSTYKKKTLAAYEKQKEKVLDMINGEENIEKLIPLILQEVNEIKEGIHYINYNEIFRSCCQTIFMMKTCRNMMLSGASLTEIAKYVPESQLGDIYHLGKDFFGISLELSEEEKGEVAKYDEMRLQGKGHGITMRDVMRLAFLKGVPRKNEDGTGWSIEGEVVYDTMTMASLYAECEVSYPYYNENKLNPCYAKSFEEILSKIMLNPEDISFTGLEKAYSNQEWNLIQRLQQKLLVKWNE